MTDICDVCKKPLTECRQFLDSLIFDKDIDLDKYKSFACKVVYKDDESRNMSNLQRERRTLDDLL